LATLLGVRASAVMDGQVVLVIIAASVVGASLGLKLTGAAVKGGDKKGEEARVVSGRFRALALREA
jgi:hypothetical protein